MSITVVKIFIDICNAAKTMWLGKGSSLPAARGRGFKSSARVEYLGTALASTSVSVGYRVRLNKFLNVYS